jgi:ankyrin repeat protein
LDIALLDVGAKHTMQIGRTALHVATSGVHVEVVSKLLAAGANKELKDKVRLYSFSTAIEFLLSRT